ncbi:ABC transporter substrate-binding protein [Qipengyuania aquimaris]|uniref:ABC transporter substrate-binding protein n=1 Tax=Qipengyuania aquimaris TaxID=255984 RepID=UPI001FD5CDD5|nr:ABC transporter substrate-binding protein [Qipengyuania aquimaris]UOR16340.1 ABC transporter substrate-binding protein [Qipengyuania aquimaris]
MTRPAFAFLVSLALASCGVAQDDGVVDIAYIEPGAVTAEDSEESFAGRRAVLAASRQGLVRFNAVGEVVPALAERWIVTDDGRSYIFRITEFDLPDGSRLTAQAVAASIRQTIRNADGTSLGLDLAKVTDVRAMTGRVIEIRLTSPMPAFLQLLAQPELGVSIADGMVGPMSLELDGETRVLEAIPPEARGLAEQPGWEDMTRTVAVTPVAAEQAARAFSQGEFDMILGGRAASLPLAITGALARGTVRLDSPIGLFGFAVARQEGILSSAAGREAVAIAIDRSAMVQQLNLGGWADTTRIVPLNLPGYGEGLEERWSTLTLDQRRARASAAVSSWENANGRDAAFTIELPQGPGSDLMFASLRSDMERVGIAVSRAAPGEGGHLVLKDETARYTGARWFLNQFNCAVSPGVCSEDADFLVQLALDAASPEEEASYLAEAETTLLATNLYIPLGAPIRWSQVRAGVEGFAENAWAFHPLFPLSRAPI